MADLNNDGALDFARSQSNGSVAVVFQDTEYVPELPTIDLLPI